MPSLMKRFLKLIGFGLLTALPGLSFAGLITEYYTSTITNAENTTGVSLGDTFTWSVTFDDTSQRATWDYDGFDRVANTADDTPGGDWCVGGTADGCSDPTVYSDQGYTMFSDAQFSVAFDLAGAAGSGFIPDDIFNANYARVYDYRGDRYYNWSADYFAFSARSYFGRFLDTNGRSHTIGVNYFSDLTAVVSATVPEPSTIPLLALGLLALVVYRRSARTGA